MLNFRWYLIAAVSSVCLLLAVKSANAASVGLRVPDAQVEKVAEGFSFTEGPATDNDGNVYFSDIPNNHIHKWSPDGKISLFRDHTGGANGNYFDRNGNLISCEGTLRRVTSTDSKGKVSVLADGYQGKKLNSPNDLWIDPKGGIYFTDPRYGDTKDLEQDGEHVYYISPDGKNVARVIADMVRPNGLIGTPDGKILYVADHGGDKTYSYAIQPDGTLAGKKLFAPQGSDGMTLDERGNVYLTSKTITVYAPDGTKIETIEVPLEPANVTFGGKNGMTLFITARTTVFTLQMSVHGDPWIRYNSIHTRSQRPLGTGKVIRKH